MRKLKVPGLLGASALAAAFCVCLALAQSSSKSRTVDVSVDSPAPPQNMTLTCGYVRDGGIWVNWTLGTAIDVDIDSPFGHKTADGSDSKFIAICTHCPVTYNATFHTGEGTSATLSCSTILTSPGDCFLAGTQVLLADGSYKNIEDVKAGDQVMSYDTGKGKFIGAAVAGTSRHENDLYYVINGDVKVTANHVFMVNGEWSPVSSMKVGDQLLNANGEPVAITSISEVNEQVDVYNLVTDEPHDFFAQNYLVHNEDEERAQNDRGLAAGMKVAMADGRELEIEKVKAGDKILTFDAKLKRYAISVVKATGKQSVSKTLLINRTLRIAKGHPMYKVPKVSSHTIPAK